jgi:hypothetical protein
MLDDYFTAIEITTVKNLEERQAVKKGCIPNCRNAGVIKFNL